jgi:hypothetical protein
MYTSWILRLRPSWKRFIQKDGSLAVRLTESVYGLIEAGALWGHSFTKQLEELGFTATREDPRMFYKRDGADFMIFSVHVDDLLGGASRPEMITDFINQGRSSWPCDKI